MIKKTPLVVVPAVVVLVATIAHTQPKPPDMNEMVKNTLAAELAKCPKDQPAPKKGADVCKGALAKCHKFDPPISDRCGNQARNYLLRDIMDYSLFGDNDCAIDERGRDKRTLQSITRVVVHNGGAAKKNADYWRCKTKDTDKDGVADADASSLSHYTINRDGTIFQHAGEEWITTHGDSANRDSIGIELETGRANGKHCNDMRAKAKDADVVAACTPTDKQYASLKRLVYAITMRTSVKVDVDHIIGHCEVGPHGDPRAFDWTKIDLSNADKRKRIKSLAKGPYDCAHYDIVK